MGEQDLADPVLLNLDHIDLARFEVVGNYVRFDEKTRHLLKDFRRKVMAGVFGPLRRNGDKVLLGSPGFRKTFLLPSLAPFLGGAVFVVGKLPQTTPRR